MKRRVDLFLAAAIFILASNPAHAYLDATSGSLLSQLLLGGLAGWILMARLGWQGLMGLWRRKEESAQPAP